MDSQLPENASPSVLADSLPCLELKHGAQRFYVNPDSALAQATLEQVQSLFDPSWLQRHVLELTTKGGRGQTWLFSLDLTQVLSESEASAKLQGAPVAWCYRKYLRGGLVGKVITESFLRCSSTAHRAHDEFKMLRTLRCLGVPVPKPIVAYEQVGLLSVKNAIIIEQIPHTQNLAEILSQRPLESAELNAVGCALFSLFVHNVHHTDLNLRNILLDEQGYCYIIDFDKCSFETNPFRSPVLIQQMLQRLQRSFVKAQSLGHTSFYQESMMEHMRHVAMQLMVDTAEQRPLQLDLGQYLKKPPEAQGEDRVRVD